MVGKKYLIESVDHCGPQAPSGEDTRDTVLTFFKTSWGEIDGYLPILYKLKERCPRWRIIAVLQSDVLVEKIDSNRALYAGLKQTVDALIYPAPDQARLSRHKKGTENNEVSKKLKKQLRNTLSHMPILAPALDRIRKQKRFARYQNFLFPGFIRPESVKLILKDHSYNTEFETAVKNVCPEAKVVGYPHGTNPFIPQNRFYDHTVINLQKRRAQNSMFDLLLLGYHTDASWFSYIPAKLEVVGHPRYDRWWVEKLLGSGILTGSDELKRAEKAGRVVTFFTRGIDIYLSESLFDYLVSSAAEILLRETDTLLLIKPHPRQDISLIEGRLKDYAPEQWMISALQPMQLANISDFVVSMYSSTILDTLVVGKPVVEFYQFNNTAIPEFIHNEDGTITSPFRYLDLAIPADTKEELALHVTDYFSENRGVIWEQQQARAKEFLLLDNNSANRAVESIIHLIES